MSNHMEKLKQAKEMLDMGIISEDDFEKIKQATLKEMGFATGSHNTTQQSKPSPPPLPQEETSSSRLPGIVVDQVADDSWFNSVESFMQNTMPEDTLPRLLVDSTQPLHLSKMVLTTKMFPIATWIAAPKGWQNLSQEEAFQCLSEAVVGIQEIHATQATRKVLTHGVLPTLKVHKPRALNLFNVPDLWLFVVPSPEPKHYNGWCIFFYSNRGWMCHDPITQIAQKFGYTILFE